jgi:hypothetical protein
MKRDLQSTLDLVQRSVTRGVFWTVLVRFSAIVLGVLGVLALLARSLLDMPLERVAWIFAAWACVPLLALWYARSKRLSRTGAAAWLDLQAGSSGIVVTSSERDGAAWSGALQSALQAPFQLPRAHVGRAGLALVLALLFAAAALWVPIPRTVVGPPLALQKASIERVAEQLATLKEEVELEPSFTEEVEASLERIDQGEASSTAEATFEALDRALERLSEEAESRAEVALDAQAGLEQAAAGASTDAEAAQAELERAMRELSRAGMSRDVEESLQEAQGLEASELPPGIELASGDIQKLAQDLNGRLGAKLGKLARAGLLKPGKLERAARELAKLGEYREHVCDENCAKQLGGKCSGTGQCQGSGHASDGSTPGNGGISRGRADAALTYGEESAGQTERFEATPLPPSERLDLEHSVTFGVGATAPEVDPTAEAAGLAPLDAKGGKSAWRRRLAPHHQDAVRTFFTRDNPK